MDKADLKRKRDDDRNSSSSESEDGDAPEAPTLAGRTKAGESKAEHDLPTVPLVAPVPEVPNPAEAPTLAKRMKAYEAQVEYTIPSAPTVMRVDGHCFSKFTSFFQRPFDLRIHQAMLETCKDLLKANPAATVGYTFSDEITLVFPSGINAFNNRVQKVSSLAAGLASVRFAHHMREAIAQHADLPRIKPQGIEKVETTHFDARVFAVPSVDEALNCLVWRCRGDAVRNAVSGFARKYYSSRRLTGMRTGEVLAMLERDKGIVFANEAPSWAQAGTLVKRKLVEIEGLNPKTGETERAIRTRMLEVDRGVLEYSEENLKLVTDKYWSDSAYRPPDKA
jgi:tRNA(His) guanylyltransferase